jgi:phosphoribosyl-AMP cyclohydrolase
VHRDPASDCDNDVVLLLKVMSQLGHEPADPSIACHTGRHSACFP